MRGPQRSRRTLTVQHTRIARRHNNNHPPFTWAGPHTHRHYTRKYAYVSIVHFVPILEHRRRSAAAAIRVAGHVAVCSGGSMGWLKHRLAPSVSVTVCVCVVRGTNFVFRSICCDSLGRSSDRCLRFWKNSSGDGWAVVGVGTAGWRRLDGVTANAADVRCFVLTKARKCRGNRRAEHARTNTLTHTSERTVSSSSVSSEVSPRLCELCIEMS